MLVSPCVTHHPLVPSPAQPHDDVEATSLEQGVQRLSVRRSAVDTVRRSAIPSVGWSTRYAVGGGRCIPTNVRGPIQGTNIGRPV